MMIKPSFLIQVIQCFFAIFIVALPLYIIRFKVVEIPSTLLEQVFFCFLILCAWYLYQSRTGAIYTRTMVSFFKKHIKEYQILYYLMGLVLICGITAIFLASNTKAAVGIFKAYFVEPIVLCLALLFVVKKIRLTTPFLFGSSGLIIWLFILCVLQTFFGVLIFAPDEASINRATGTFTTPNALGLLVGPPAAIIASYSLSHKNYLLRFSVSIIVSLAASIIVLSQSITSLLALLSALSVMLMLYLFFADKKWDTSLKRISLVSVVTIVVSSILFFSLLLPKLTPKIIGPSLPADSLTIRFYLWQGTFEMLKDNISGVGLSSFPKMYEPYRIYKDDAERKGFAEMPLYPHNMLLNFWSEIGPLGALLFFLLCAIALWKIIPYREDPFALGLIGAFTYILVHGLTDVPYFKNDLSFLFWILVGFAFSLKYITEVRDER